MALVVASVAIAAAAWVVLTPFGPSTEVFVELPQGSSTVAIGRQLEQAGIIRSQYAFDLVRGWRHGTLHAGEYRFDRPASVLTVYRRIARGDIFTLPVTIPEGANIYEIADRIEQVGLVSRKEFLEAAVSETGLISDLDPEARSLEGYLFPATYRFARKATAAHICAAMVRQFRTEAEKLGLKENTHKVVTLASLVEKETAVEAERPLVASVFTNRLAHNMPLMTDPSVIYGLVREGRWTGVIYRSDLKGDTPYNTYLHAGLPPGPVANPGLHSLRAAMNPAQTDYLYFVAAGADPQGHSRFARSMEEHEHNVAGYRQAMKKAGER